MTTFNIVIEGSSYETAKIEAIDLIDAISTFRQSDYEKAASVYFMTKDNTWEANFQTGTVRMTCGFNHEPVGEILPLNCLTD